jgi:tripartite-type tricarboxylate transporter receptor subunit TctC
MQTLISLCLRHSFLVLVLSVLPLFAIAQEYPTRSITMLCWSEPGSPVDLYARVLAKLLSQELGQNVIVENRTGGDGIVMVNNMLRQPTDGYTVASVTLTLATLFGEPATTFKPDDLQMVARSQIDPYSLIVPTSSRLRTIDDFVKTARANPGKLTVGGPFGMSSHRVFWEIFSGISNITTNWIPYKGGGPAMNAVAGGQVDAGQTNPGNVKPLVAAGKLRVIAVSANRRLPDFPDAPTFKESGWDVERYQWRGVMAKAGLPQAILNKLVAAIQRAQQKQEWKAYLERVSQLDGFQDPVEFTEQLMRDISEIGVVKKKLGL